MRVPHDDAALDTRERVEHERHRAVGKCRVHRNPEPGHLARLADRFLRLAGEIDAASRVGQQSFARSRQLHTARV